MSDLRFPTSPSDAVLLLRTLYANRIVRFLTVGGTCGLVQLSILHGLVVSGIEEHVSNLIAFVISMEMNFVLNQLFTWRDRWSSSLTLRKIVGRLLLFNVSASLTAGVINQGTFALMNLFMWYLPAGAIGIAVAAFANFMLNDRLVFRLWSTSGTRATIAES
ncbi:MAG TPA: GtrA family protein [Dehalococcoidia bacterium]|nr:GtrA family protein [Dehalococcoidia bacterium]